MARQPTEIREYLGEEVTITHIFWSGARPEIAFQASWTNSKKPWRDRSTYGETPHLAFEEMKKKIEHELEPSVHLLPFNRL